MAGVGLGVDRYDMRFEPQARVVGEGIWVILAWVKLVEN
jgi:hypothetical protein